MGGGEDDGYAAKQAQTEQEKQRARALLNAQFGIADETVRTPPTREAFMKSGGQQFMFTGGEGGAEVPIGPAEDTFDEAGYNAALDLSKQGAANAGARDSLYQTVRDNTFNAGKRRLDEQKTDAGRKLKFELFARGLNGGSEDINQNALLGRTYSDGLLDLGGKADAARARFQGDDENTRLSLLQSIDAGMDQGSAVSSAINSMKVNADKAAAEATGTTLGDLFSNTGLIYNQSQAAKGKAAGSEWWNTYGSGLGKKGAASGVNGITTSLPGER